MTEFVMERFSYAPTETEGRITLEDGKILWTIERPWIPYKNLGGKPFESCIPDGRYRINRWRSPRFGDCLRLSNPELFVFEEGADPGRDFVLVHVGNWAFDTQGCILVGMERGILTGQRAVLRSRPALDLLMGRMTGDDHLVITNTGGASGVA